MPYTYSIIYYARGIAYAVLGRVKEAIHQEKLFKETVTNENLK